MKAVDDQRWRHAAEDLGLGLFTAKGREVERGKGKRTHRMRGELEGRRVVVRFGLQDAEDGITVIDVRLRRPLLLGLLYRVTAPPKDYRGRRVGVRQTEVDGIDRDRVRAALDRTEAGIELSHLLEQLGSLGWVELGDRSLSAQLEIVTDLADGYAQAIRAAARAARLAEELRAALDPLPWEETLRAKLAAAGDELRLDVDSRRFAVTGRIRGIAASLALSAEGGYAVVSKVELPEPLPAGTVERRVGFWSTLRSMLRLEPRTGDAAFDAAFRVTGELAAELSPHVTQALVALARRGDVRVDAAALTHRTSDLAVDPVPLLQELVRAAEHLGVRAGASPYR